MKREINYKTMRVVVGIIAILLAPAVWLLAGAHVELNSISAAYWSDARDVFVGALVAVGFFLLAYNGQGGKADWEFYLSKAACLFAACVALFPTTDPRSGGVAPAWAVKLSSLFGLHPGGLSLRRGSAVVCLSRGDDVVLFDQGDAQGQARPRDVLSNRCDPDGGRHCLSVRDWPIS